MEALAEALQLAWLNPELQWQYLGVTKKKTGVPVMAMQVDITNRLELEPAMKKVENELGKIGILVNNAGIVSLRGGVLNETEEIAGTAIFLASKASDFVTGETIRVDGGYAIR